MPLTMPSDSLKMEQPPHTSLSPPAKRDTCACGSLPSVDMTSMNRQAMAAVGQGHPADAYRWYKLALLWLKQSPQARSPSLPLTSYGRGIGYAVLPTPSQDRQSPHSGSAADPSVDDPHSLPLVFDVEVVLQQCGLTDLNRPAATNLAAALVIYNMAVLLQLAAQGQPQVDALRRGQSMHKAHQLYIQAEKFVLHSHPRLNRPAPSGIPLLDLFRACHLYNWASLQQLASAAQPWDGTLDQKAFAFVCSAGRSSFCLTEQTLQLLDEAFGRMYRRLFSCVPASQTAPAA